LQLHWNKCSAGTWCVLTEIDLAKVEGQGVFIVWRNGDPRRSPAVLYVGRGSLKRELDRCRRDPLFQGATHAHVTWATIENARDVEPIAAYLYQQLRPLWGEVVPPFPKPAPVNLPLSA
jgi:hypothetical protein